jgi:rubrerythrin
MVVFICRHCRFRFNAEKPRDCPYCGRDTLEREKSAEELLDDVNDLLQE